MKRTRNRFLHYFGDYRFNSLFFKNLYQLLLLILIPVIGATLLGYYAYSNMQDSDIDAYCEKIATETVAKFDEIIDNAYMELMYFGISRDVELFLLDEYLNEDFYKVENIKQMIKMPIIVKSYVNSIYIYADSIGTVISSSGIDKYETFLHRDLLDQCKRKIEGQKAFFLTTTRDIQKVRKTYLTACCKIQFGENASGYAVMNLDRKTLIKELNVPDNTEFYVLKDSVVWLASDNSALGKTAQEMNLRDADRDGEYCYSIIDNKTGLEYLVLLDLNDYHDGLRDVRIVFVLLLFVVAWIAVTFAAIISIRIYQPVEKILSMVKEEIPSVMDEDDQMLAKNELDFILQSIEKTSLSQKATIEKLKERTHLLKKGQSVALQAQISPHFLNNTLETINWSAMELLGSNNSISEITSALSLMLRMALEKSDVLIPVSREIEHCRSYLDIQKYRYEDKFDVIWDVDPDVLQFKTVKIVLQPLVENAIYHGMKLLSNKGLIIISGRVTDEFVELCVKDNGLGMSKEQLEELQNIMKQEEIRENKHIGFANVNQRIKLLFGEEYGLELESELGFGTSAHIRFPRVL